MLLSLTLLSALVGSAAAAPGEEARLLRFPATPADAVMVHFKAWEGPLTIAEIGVY